MQVYITHTLPTCTLTVYRTWMTLQGLKSEANVKVFILFNDGHMHCRECAPPLCVKYIQGAALLENNAIRYIFL